MNKDKTKNLLTTEVTEGRRENQKLFLLGKPTSKTSSPQRPQRATERIKNYFYWENPLPKHSHRRGHRGPQRKQKSFLCEALKPKSSSPQRSQRRAKAIVFGKPETNPFSPQRATEKTKIFFCEALKPKSSSPQRSAEFRRRVP